MQGGTHISRVFLSDAPATDGQRRWHQEGPRGGLSRSSSGPSSPSSAGNDIARFKFRLPRAPFFCSECNTITEKRVIQEGQLLHSIVAFCCLDGDDVQREIEVTKLGWSSMTNLGAEMADLMDAPGRWDSKRLLAGARAGDADCLGWLLEIYRNYLQVLASAQLNERLRRRVNPSDLVQETFLRASRHFGEFCGSSEQEWLGWLRTILPPLRAQDGTQAGRGAEAERSAGSIFTRTRDTIRVGSVGLGKPGRQSRQLTQHTGAASGTNQPPGRASVQVAGALPRSPGATASGRAQLSRGCPPHGTAARSSPSSLVACARAAAATTHD